MSADDCYAASTVQDAWNNHLSAFGAQDIAKTMLDYDDKSVLIIFDHTTGKKDEYVGVEAICQAFTSIFKILSDTSDLECPLVEVSEEGKMVLIAWKCPASGVANANDTFIFDSNNKIARQNVVMRTASNNSAG